MNKNNYSKNIKSENVGKYIKKNNKKKIQNKNKKWQKKSEKRISKGIYNNTTYSYLINSF